MFFTQNSYNIERFKTELNSEEYLSSKKKIIKKINSRDFGFLQDIFDDNLDEIIFISKKLKNFKTVLFLGTGGSSLGGKTLVSFNNYLFEKSFPNIFFLENIDEHSINCLVNRIDLNNTAVVVISKSGETIETISQFFFIKNKMKSVKDKHNRFFVITENKKSTLKDIQESEGYYFIEHKKNIGGRFSIFSVVGLLPAAISGFKINEFREGGLLFLEHITNHNGKLFDDLFLISTSLIKMSKENYNISVFMPYVDRLYNLSYWYRQLWAESVGKNNMGITPVNALGTVDQHSQLQLYLDGPKDKFFTFISTKFNHSKHTLDCSFGKNKKYKLLHNKSLEKLLFFEMKATIEILKKKKMPIRVIEINEINEGSLGSIVMYFFIETIFSCYLMNVNPFDQPAVEEGKTLTKKFLEND